MNELQHTGRACKLAIFIVNSFRAMSVIN